MMCFRPAQIEMNICPNCGKANKPIAKVCEQCGAELGVKKQDFDADAAGLAAQTNVTRAPGAPSAPKAPQSPSVPQGFQTSSAPAPQMPGAAKAPQAPAIPKP